MQNILIRIRRDANLKDLLRHSGMLYASGLLSITLTFIQQITTARLLGSADYGRLAIVLSSGFVITILLDFRTWELGSKLLAEPLQTKNSSEAVQIISWLTLLEFTAGMVGFLIMLIAAGPIATSLLDNPELTWLIQLYALNIPFKIMTTGILSVVPRFFDRFDWLASKAVAYALIRLVLISGAAFLGFGLVGVVIAALVSEVLHLLIMIVMDQSMADNMGMIGTVINALALQDALHRAGVQSRVQTAITMNQVAEPYIRLRAIRHMEKGRVVIIAGGTGNPYFTTDTAAALRAKEINAEIVIKATQVNGVYSADPKKDPTATRFDTLTYDQVLQNKYQVMDMTAFTLCQENNMPIMVVNFWADHDLYHAVLGDTSVGTVIRD